jgi:uncharacterized protein (DUF302 family)
MASRSDRCPHRPDEEDSMTYATGTTIDAPFAQTLERVRAELDAQGFGVLTEIDVRRTLHDTLAEDVEDYVILGACNPLLAHRALQVDPSIGLLLTCNVVVRAVGARTAVEYVDPHAMITLTRLADLEAVAEEAATGLRAALQALHQPALQAGDDPSGG